MSQNQKKNVSDFWDLAAWLQVVTHGWKASQVADAITLFLTSVREDQRRAIIRCISEYPYEEFTEALRELGMVKVD